MKRDAHGWAEAVEAVGAIEGRVLVTAVAERNVHVLIAPGKRECHALKELEGVGQVDTDMVLPGIHIYLSLEGPGASRAHTVPPGHEV